MLKQSIDRLLPGMILTKPVSGANGMVLLAEGTELNEKWIDRLESMGIDGVWIEGKAEQVEPLEDAILALDRRFEPVVDAPYMTTIKNLVKFQIEKLYT
jgi:hypothetical protein